jgi:hypothetical protein
VKVFKLAEYQCIECGEALSYGRNWPADAIASGTAWVQHGSATRWSAYGGEGFVKYSNAGKLFAAPVEILELEPHRGA